MTVVSKTVPFLSVSLFIFNEIGYAPQRLLAALAGKH